MEKKSRTNEEIHRQNLLSIEDSAIALLLETGDIAAITVSELCRRAGVSRQTFYKNYAGVEDAVRLYIRKDFEDIFRSFSHWFSDGRTRDALTELLQAFYERRDLYQILYLHNDSLILHQFESFIDENNLSHFRLDDLEKDYFTGAFFEVIKQWILRDCKETVEEIAVFLEKKL